MRRFLAAVPVVVLAAALAACGSDDDSSTAATTTSQAPVQTSNAAQTSSVDQTDTIDTTSEETPAMTMPGNPDIPIVPGTADAFTGSWRDPDGGAIVTFADDGTLVGTDGCNNFHSTWAYTSGSGGEGAVIQVEPFPTTMMACTEAWSPWVLSMHTVTHNGDHLSLRSEGGIELGELIPAVPA
ncbi:META domain-containing protein [Corynebacterium terpenotabidum]|uniref:DUF306 domain-containing protein n=1 Tax=Corynebacterium terpenotabidum Y-11 TaxID=1200352 RepID=S4XGF1_9CORY|nr:META domain-containing protein [Corynebacterium terpenotabidum]AGP30730.1 hypothetical protein A606_05415 [Corynebacterium terpenotabidum Y-11]